MDALLTPVSTTYNKAGKKDVPLLTEVTDAPPAPARREFTSGSAEEALEILRSEPDYETLLSVLQFVLTDRAPIAIRHPTPLSAQLVQVLVTAIVPNYWTLLHEESGDDKDRKELHNKKTKKRKRERLTDLELLLTCLRSVTGLSALVVRLRALLAEAKTTATAKDSAADPTWQLKTVLEVVSELLIDEASVFQIWEASVSGADGDAKKRPLTREFLNVLAGGRVVSLSAEADAIIKEQSNAEKYSPSWLGDGKKYSLWLTRGIVQWNTQDTTGKNRKILGDLVGKALQLGYPDLVISTLVSELLLSRNDGSESSFSLLLDQLPAHQQKKVLLGVLKFASETYFSSASGDPSSIDSATVSSVAGLVKRAIGNSYVLREQLVTWLLTAPATGLANEIGARRAAMAVVAEDPKSVSAILEKSMAEFGDQLFIKHTPVIQQEAKAQVLLLSAGYVHRAAPRALASLLRSRTYLDAVSNRLGASQNRARFLGMVAGEAISSLVDDGQKKLDFHMEEMESDEANWYKTLVHVSDTVGPIESLRSRKDRPKNTSHASTAKTQPQKPTAKVAPRRPLPPQTTGFVIEELDDDNSEGSDAEDDDLVPYAKPDSDAEDSDDDPTSIRRDKPKAPVYIRDLIAYFRDTESYDKQKLALTTAPVLIRRKANFGTEVQQHAKDLASILVGLQDTFELDDFYQLRLQSMVALVVAQPRLVGPWFSWTFFEGDYSLSQRASVLTALGLGARELAGFETSEYAAAAAFPSKQLPERMERLYLSSTGPGAGGRLQSGSSLKALPPGALDSVADSLTASFLGPIAAKAADEATGPDVLKLASFKSRIEQSGKVTKQKKVGTSGGRPAAANTAAQAISSAFFFPLIARFQLALQAASSARMRGVLFEPSLLSLYLKTLAVVLHACGPSALSLPDMTAELWSLLLSSSVQAHCVGDPMVTHAVLFSLLALLDVNENRLRDLCRELPREVVQTRDWVTQVLQNTQGQDAASGGQESEIQMLATGTYIRLTEGMESYKNLLLGEMIG